MNWDQIEIQWKQLKMQMSDKWTRLTEDDLNSIAGNRNKLLRRLRSRYGQTKGEAEKDADSFALKLGSISKKPLPKVK